MKKFYVALILLLSLCLTGCFKTPVEPNEGSITLKLPDEYTQILSVSEIPEFEFTFNGTLNTVLHSDSYVKVFSHNDDKILSDAINKLIDKHKDRMFVVRNGAQKVESTLFSKLDEFGKVENTEYTPDNKMVYDETAYLNLENGLKLSIDYRRFIYNGENYYTWKYNISLSMYLYYPMMAVENGLTNKVVLITLPNGVTFKIGPNLKLSSIVNEKTYVDKQDSIYYTFNYFDLPKLPPDDKEILDKDKDKDKKPELTEEEKQKLIKERQKYVIDYYVNYHDAKYNMETKTLTYSYLGNKFKVELFDNNFKMHYVE